MQGNDPKPRDPFAHIRPKPRAGSPVGAAPGTPPDPFAHIRPTPAPGTEGGAQPMPTVRVEATQPSADNWEMVKRGAKESLYAPVQGLAAMADWLPGIEGAEDWVGERREAMRRKHGDPVDAGDMALLGGTAFVGTAAQFMAPPLVAARLAQGAAAGSRAAQALRFLANPIGRFGRNAAGEINAAGRIASGTAFATPLNLLQSQSEQDNAAAFVAQLTEKATGPTGGLVHSIAEGATKSPLRRFAFETAFDLAAGSAFEGAAHGVRSTIRNLRGVPTDPHAYDGFIRAPEGQVPKLRPETDPARLLAAENPELPPSPLPPEGPAIPMPGEVRPVVPELARPVEQVPLTHGRGGLPETVGQATQRLQALAGVAAADATRAVGDIEVIPVYDPTTRLHAREVSSAAEQAAKAEASARALPTVDPEVDFRLQQAARQAPLPEPDPIIQPAGPVLTPRPPEPTVRTHMEQVGATADAALRDLERVPARVAAATPGLRRGPGAGNRPGFVDPVTMGQIAATGAGAAGGGLVGDTPDERLKNAMMAAGLFAGSTAAARSGFVARLYSRLERAIKAAPFEKGQGRQWLAALSKNVAKGEREFTGVERFLQERLDKPVTRVEVLRQYERGKIELNETVRIGRTRRAMTPLEVGRLERALRQAERDLLEAGEHADDITNNDLAHLIYMLPDAELEDIFGTRAVGQGDIKQVLDELGDGNPAPLSFDEGGPIDGGVTRYQDYMVPGKHEDYRETTIELHTPSGNEKFISPHWDDAENPMPHTRTSVRTVPGQPGKKFLFVEDIQDDWAQQGRTTGYNTPENEAAKAKAKEEVYELYNARNAARDAKDEELQKLKDWAASHVTPERLEQTGEIHPSYSPIGRYNTWSDVDGWVRRVAYSQVVDANEVDGRVLETLQKYGIDPEEFNARVAKAQRLHQQYRDAQRAYNEKQLLVDERLLPDRPFQKTTEWVELALKKHLDMAAEQDLDHIVFATGDQARAAAGGDAAGQRAFYDEIVPNVIKAYEKKLGVSLNVRKLSDVIDPEYAPLRQRHGELMQELEAHAKRYDELRAERAQTQDQARIDQLNEAMRDVQARAQALSAGRSGVAERLRKVAGMELSNNVVLDVPKPLRERILKEGQALWSAIGMPLAGAASAGYGLATDNEEALAAGAFLIGRPVRSAKAPLVGRFLKARSASTRAAYLSPLTADDLIGKRIALGHGDRVGYVIDADGDLQNVFNNGGPRGAGRLAVLDALQNGARSLDAFDGHLPNLYAGFGFEEVGRLRFNREYAPAGWDYAAHGEPDVVFMARTGEPRPDAVEAALKNEPPPDAHRVDAPRYFDSYDDAKLAQREALARSEAAAGGARPASRGGVDAAPLGAHPAAGPGNRRPTTGTVGQRARGRAGPPLARLRKVQGLAPAVTQVLKAIDDPQGFFRAIGDKPQQLERTLVEFRATAPAFRRAALAAGEDAAAVDDILTGARSVIEGRLDALRRADGPLGALERELEGVQRTSVEDAAAHAEQDTRRRLREWPGRRRGERVDLSRGTPEQRAERAATLGLEDAKEAVRLFGKDAAAWYKRSFEQYDAQLQAFDPRLRGDPAKRFIAHVVLAITSNGANVRDNLHTTLPIIRQWLDTGQLTVLDVARGIDPAVGAKSERTGFWRQDIKGNRHAPAVEVGLRKLQLFIDAEKGDLRKVREFLDKDWVDQTKAGVVKAQRPMTAEVFGPKVGRFVQNLLGSHGEVTVDTWALRTWMRWQGYGPEARLLTAAEAAAEEASEGAMRAGPNPVEAAEIREAFAKLAPALSKETGQHFDPSDVQALLWYLEKWRYGKWGSPSELISFADAGDAVLRQGIPTPGGEVSGSAYRFKGLSRTGTRGLKTTQVKEHLAARGVGNNVYDLGGAVGAAMREEATRRVARGMLMGATGLALQEADDEKLRWTGTGLMLLGAASAGWGPLKAAARAGGLTLRDQLAQSETGRALLNALSRDILADPQLKELVQAARREMAFYRARGQELAARSRALGPEGDRVVSDLVEGEHFADISALDGETMGLAVALAQRVADEVQGLGHAKVATGRISEATRRKRERTYLRRMYAVHEADAAQDDAMAVGRGSGKWRIAGEKVRNDELTVAERNALGEIREASVRLAETFARGGKDVATARLFQGIAAIPGAVHPAYLDAMEDALTARLLASHAAATGDKAAAGDAYKAFRLAKGEVDRLSKQFDRAGGEYERLPDTEALGVLRGAVVRRDVAGYLNGVPELEKAPGVWRKALHAWKIAHTVYNPGTHGGNFASNVGMAHLGGLPYWEQPFAIPAASRDMKAYGHATRVLTEAGVIDRGLALYGDIPVQRMADERTSLRTLARTTRPETRAALERQGIEAMGDLEFRARQFDAKAKRIYGWGDAVFRVALFQKFVKGGMSEADAIQRVLKVLPHYDTRSPILNALKNSLSPFVLYPAKYIPAAVDLIMEHPERWVTLAALWTIADQASRRAYGPVEEKDLPKRDRTSKALGYLVPGRTQVDAIVRPVMSVLGIEPRKEDKYTFDVARWTPFSALTGSPAPGALATQLSDNWPAILNVGGPLVDLGARAMNTDPFTGEKWWRPGDDARDKAGKALQALAATAAPSALSFHLPRVIEDLQNRDPAAAAVDAMGFAGLRPSVVRPGMQARREQWSYEDKVEDVRRSLRQAVRKSKSPERTKALQERARQKLRALAEERRKERQP